MVPVPLLNFSCVPKAFALNPLPDACYTVMATDFVASLHKRNQTAEAGTGTLRRAQDTMKSKLRQNDREVSFAIDAQIFP